jgi:putative ABC transport system permease protein
MVWAKMQGGHNAVSGGDFTDWQRESKVFQDIHAWTAGAFNLATHDQPEYIPGSRATPGLATMMGYSFFLGRDLLPEEAQAGRDHVVLLTHRLWEKLGSDPAIHSQLTVPLVFSPEQLNHDFHWLRVMGRLKPGVTIKQAQADMDAVAAGIAKAYPKSNTGWGASVDPLKDDFISSDRRSTLWLLLGAVGFILLIACVNVANLLLARVPVGQTGCHHAHDRIKFSIETQ